MKNEQIQQIIREKNDQRERQVVRSAERIIELIVSEQKRIAEANKVITELRAELKALEVEQLDAATVIGE